MEKYNFKDFRPMIFDVDVVVPQDLGAKGSNSVAVNDRPFIIEMVTHQILAPISLSESVQVNQDGMYRIDWSLYQQERYWQGVPPLADTAFGSIRHGIWIPLRVPIALEKNRTINVDVTNANGSRSRDFTVHVEFHGVEDLRQAQ